MRTILTIVGTLASILTALYLALLALFDGLSTARIAGVVTVLIVALLAGIILTLAIVRMTTTARARTVTADPPETIDGAYREVTDYRPPQARLPPPARIVVPKYTNHGQAEPYGMPAAQAIPVLTTTTDAGSCEIPLNYLARFLSLDTPARSEWVGKREMYSAALEFCELHGLLERTANGGATWRQNYPIDTRRAWCEQFDNSKRGEL